MNTAAAAVDCHSKHYSDKAAAGVAAFVHILFSESTEPDS